MKTRLTSYFPACLLGVSSDNHGTNCETEHLSWECPQGDSMLNPASPRRSLGTCPSGAKASYLFIPISLSSTKYDYQCSWSLVSPRRARRAETGFSRFSPRGMRGTVEAAPDGRASQTSAAYWAGGRNQQESCAPGTARSAQRLKSR